MKLTLVLLVLMPLALAAPQKRFLLDSFGLDEDKLRNIVQDLLDTVATDKTEQGCESVCHNLLVDEASLAHTFCTPICTSLQLLAGLFNLRPQTTLSPEQVEGAAK